MLGPYSGHGPLRQAVPDIARETIRTPACRYSRAILGQGRTGLPWAPVGPHTDCGPGYRFRRSPSGGSGSLTAHNLDVDFPRSWPHHPALGTAWIRSNPSSSKGYFVRSCKRSLGGSRRSRSLTALHTHTGDIVAQESWV